MSDTENGVEEQGGEVDRNDKRLYYAVALAGVAMAVASMNAVQEPSVFTVMVPLGLFAVFIGLVRMAMPGREVAV